MVDPIVATFVILALAMVGFVSGRVPIALVAVGVALALWATGVITLPQALAGFGDSTVIFIATLFVVSEALDATGVTAWAGQQVIGRAGTGRRQLTVVVALMVAVLTAFISLNGAVAALLPVVVVVALNAGIAPSRLLLPLAFSSHAGSLLALTGTPVNVLVSDAAANAGGERFGYFEFALAGLPLLAITVAILVTFGDRLLPDRKADQLDTAPADPEAMAREFRRSYDLTHDTGTFYTPDEGVAEVMITPRSEYIGRKVFPGMTTLRENLVIIAIKRNGERHPSGSDDDEPEALRPGDSLLVRGPWDALERYVRLPGVIPVTEPQSLRRAVPLGRGARRAIAVLVAMVVLLASGLVPAVVAGLLAAGALVLLRVLDLPQVWRSIQWSTVVLIAGLIPLSTAFIETGAAELVAGWLLDLVGTASPHLALLAICLLTLLLGQVISNAATVLVMIPIALSVAATLDASVQPFMMALTVVGAAAFFTPIATPVNLMVLEPGGYKFGDYWRLGTPLALAYVVIAVLWVPVIWPF
ncbi:putative transporter [Agromyces sp. NDB4Y10]|uniref:SLC13 family permease n=1 Tax=Agromyces sp. NDB4Y10 TaxID=1775951 RepID=UPI0007B30687|nr:SLC13 family permease [Agromyces sp. NDB4Y10]KZE95381.1 putative transporter [Agromyces sp. NDB4Y10]